MPAAVAGARRLGAGGEAEVYEVAGDPRLAIKRYRQPSAARTAKLRVMVANPPLGIDDGGHVAIAWPIEVLEEGGVAAGFTMARIDNASTVPLFQVYNPQSRRLVAPAFSWRYLLRTARNIAAIVDAVHRAGHVIGDLNESNFLVSRRALVTLVDCDSLQVVDPATGELHPCPVGKPEFLAPELQRADLARTPRTEASDRFALAVLLHLLLLEGAHPFAGVWRGRGDPPDIGTRIARRTAAHHRLGPVDPAPFALDLAVLPHGLRRLFVRALGAGLRRPTARPSAAEWRSALEAAEAHLAECPRSPHHVHSAHLRRCPWCARLARGLPDPFPGAGGAGVGPPPPTRADRARGALSRSGRRLRGWAAAAMTAVAGAVGRAAATAARRLVDALRPSMGRAVPLRLTAAGLGAGAPLATMVGLCVALVVVRRPDRSGRGRGGALHRLGVRPGITRVLRPGRLASAVSVGGAAAAALLAVMVLGWGPEGATRVGTGVGAALLAQPLPTGRRPRDRAEPAGRARPGQAPGDEGRWLGARRWVWRWWVALVVAAATVAVATRASLLWPADVAGHAVRAVLR